MMEFELDMIQRLVGPVSEADLAFVDCYLGPQLSLFLPAVGPCQYSVTPDHSHPGYLFIYTYDDLCKTVIDGKMIGSKKGMLYAISPDLVHHEIADDCFSRYVAIMIDRVFFASVCAEYGVVTIPVFHAQEFPSPPTLIPLLRMFMLEAEGVFPGKDACIGALSLQICHTIVRQISGLECASSRVSNRIDIEQVIQYMNLNYHRDISLEELASTMNRSTSAFRKIFKDETGVSPLEFLIRIRLERSRKLLVGSDLPVTEIAFACGFNSSSHFTTTFSKQYSLSPRDYKKYHAIGVSAGEVSDAETRRISSARAVETG